MISEVVKLFGYIRETNYGKLFDVKTVIRPSNLAYTGLGISAHTDNPYRNPTPTLQLLHCLSSDANGGDSVLADGFRIAEDFRRQYHAYFEILTSVMVTYQFRDEENWLERSTPVITLYPDGTIAAIRLNNRSIQPVKLQPDDLLEFYKAYLQFAKMANDAAYQVRFKMSPGDLYIVDNERITHGRSAYDNKGGERWLQGAYADRDALLSKWRVLKNKRP
jgi:gamma-butyrobetaine dioxygenase